MRIIPAQSLSYAFTEITVQEVKEMEEIIKLKEIFIKSN